ncbi:MAG: AraC family transcriptional regulator [Bacteroidetes bacterium]|nr:AraC family transcriptional regulator [Bacteroidota bacterium]
MKLYVKNMVCPRCISAVQKTLLDIKVQPLQIQLGEVTLAKKLTIKQIELLKLNLEILGFELLDDNLKQQIDKIKSIIIEHVHYLEGDKFVFSEIISNKLKKEYSQLSKLFSATEGITIEQYVILQKTEKVKEYLIYNQISLSEIAYMMGYSSVSHLSSQFKKTTGFTPTQFKAQGISHRKTLDNL